MQPMPSTQPIQPTQQHTRPIKSSQRRSHKNDLHKPTFVPFIPAPTSLTPEKPVDEQPASEPTPEAAANPEPTAPEQPQIDEDAPRHVMFAPVPTPAPKQRPKRTPMYASSFPSKQEQPSTTPKPEQTPVTPKPEPIPKEEPKPEPTPKEEKSSWSLFGSLFGRSESGKKVYKVELPKDEVKPYYDEAKQKWIIPGVEEEEEAAPLPPPPPMTPAPETQPEPEPEPEPEPVSQEPPVTPLMPVAQPPQDTPQPEASSSRKQNKRVAKSKSKPRQMPMYTNPFCSVCYETGYWVKQPQVQ